MLKKVLSVVLALVLALGVCVVATSAATAADLEELLAQIPSAYNAKFYNDATEAVILEARAAAEAALESGTGINDAYALCQNAFDTAYEWGTKYIEDLDEDLDIVVNRDESKAVVEYYLSTTAEDYMMPGDEFDVTISISTNFYVQNMYTAFVYDKTKFELVPGSEVYGDGIDETLDVENGVLTGSWGYTSRGKEQATYFPESWTSATKAQYGILEKVFMFSPYSDDFFYPETKTDLVTVTMKVKDTAEEGTTGKIFVDPEIIGTWDNYLYDIDYEAPAILFQRAYGPKIFEKVADIDGVIVPAYMVTDQGNMSGQTVNLNDADYTINIGEEPVALDYTKLEEAIASFKGYNAIDWTEASWADFAAAVEAGEDEGLVATTQDDIDAYTKAIVDARTALEAFVQDSEIISITEKTTPVVGRFTTLEVLVSCPVTKLQFVNSAGGTATYYDGNDRVMSVVNNDDGTQTWTLVMMAYTQSETYQVFPKIGSTWSTKAYRYIHADTHEYDGNVYSAVIPDATDNRLYKGRHNIIVETGMDVLKVQFAYCGTTATFTESNATIEEKDGRLFWTCDFNFHKAADAVVYDINSRTTATSFAYSGVTLVVDVLV